MVRNLLVRNLLLQFFRMGYIRNLFSTKPKKIVLCIQGKILLWFRKIPFFTVFFCSVRQFPLFSRRKRPAKPSTIQPKRCNRFSLDFNRFRLEPKNALIFPSLPAVSDGLPESKLTQRFFSTLKASQTNICFPFSFRTTRPRKQYTHSTTVTLPNT